jgi:enterochelin esterase-like enzyme
VLAAASLRHNRRLWESAIGNELPAHVDARFRTIPNRSGRALIGLSAGGYGAALIGLHHLGRFSVVESWSGYFHPTDPSGTNALDLGSDSANKHSSAHSFVGSLRRLFTRHPTLFAFYVGRADRRFLSENRRLDRELSAARVPNVFHTYPGGHAQSLWKAHASGWLQLALNHLGALRPYATRLG